MSSRSRAVLGALVILALCAVCVRLGFWQLDRLQQRRARNAVAAGGLSRPPIPLSAAVLAEADRHPSEWSYRRVTARGRYDAAGELLLRGRADSGQPGVHVVTPLRLAEGGRVLLVNRGWLPAADGLRPSARPPVPGGVVEVSGLLMEVPRTGDRGQPVTGAGGGTSYRRLDLGELRRRHGAALLPVYLQAAPGGGGDLPRAVPAPALDEGPHLGYAIQWFSFAVIGVVGLSILLFRERRTG